VPGFDTHSFGARGSFAGVPRGDLSDLGEARAVIVGAPFDWGTSHRPGARFGPKAIREADYLGPDGSRPHLETGVDPLHSLGVIDIGDVDVVPGYIDESLDAIRSAVTTIAAHGAIPVVLGGDHSITLATAGGVADVLGHGSIALVHFDAHADTADTQYGQLIGHGTPMRRLIESGAVPGHRFVQIGLRGYWPPPDTLTWMREQQMRSFFMADIVHRGLDSVVDEAVTLASNGAAGVFLSIDIDVVDPGSAPGTGTPEPGGILPRELLDTVHRLGRELSIVGIDVVEVAPAYDSADVTAALANRVVLEALTGIARTI
jgi:agmatinase